VLATGQWSFGTPSCTSSEIAEEDMAFFSPRASSSAPALPLPPPGLEKPIGEPPSSSCAEYHTTVLFRNVPYVFTRDTFVELLNSQGFQGKFDLVYVPMDFKTNREASGWGLTVAAPGGHALLDYCGPTVTNVSDPCYIGATQHSNNVGELSALFFGLSWLRGHLSTAARQPAKAIIEYDSEYAAGVIQRRTRARQNLTLVLRARHIYDQISSSIEWRKVESHTGQFLNERADHLANCGASGMYCGLPDATRWAQDTSG
ncbi:unnamed protein product, partial [Prorocentrum cordatum]